MSTANIKRFGGAIEAALSSVVETAGNTISADDAGTREAFLNAWIRTLVDYARFIRSSSNTLKAPVIVAYVPDVGQFAHGIGWERRAMLRASHISNFAGMLAAGTGEIAGYVCPRELKPGDTKNIEREIRNVGLELALTIGLMSEEKLIVWPDGIEGSTAPIERNLDNDCSVVINRTKIDGELTLFYEVHARQTMKWWKNAALRVTVETPEGAVQEDLRLFLLARNSDIALIRAEESIGNGRADITIAPIPKRATGESAVLELKTIRDVRTPKTIEKTPTKISEKDNINWASSGISQTAAYRDQNKLDAAFLCVYDFCSKSNTTNVDKEVMPAAEQYNVLYRRYWITATHKEHRKERYPLKPS